MQKLSHPAISFSLVIIQFACILFLLWLEPWLASGILATVQLFAIIVGITAVYAMHLDHLSVLPDPLPNIQLVTTGPYRWIRHPMYASILYFFTPILLTSSNLISWLIFIILIIDLLFKLHYEEKLLTERLADYTQYQQHTKKLIPYLY